MRAAIIGIAGLSLTDAETALLHEKQPGGVILFARNVADPHQLTALTAALRAALPPNAVIAIDQEGGRVARLRPPHWRAHPPAAKLITIRAAYLTGALIGLECARMGFDLVCAPVLDRHYPQTTDAIGDRTFAPTPPETVATLARAYADGLMHAGVIPVAKHAPGHGRATVDSHQALPIVPADIDLTPDIDVFRACAELPWMMTAHLLYQGLDPDRPATLSPTIIQDVIRARIGFAGVLVSDDLAMHALTGSPGHRAAAAIAAGCDVAMHCTGDIADSRDILASVPTLDLTRWTAARAQISSAQIHLDEATLAAERRVLIGC